LLFNEQGELMETRIFNVFLVINGICWTPALSSGCLPGVYREQLLRAGAAQERTLTIKDLGAASQIFVTNSLRGQLRAEMMM
jgi:branched-subunit amino acid aminotransferase/4-amino-4-deoxychorismate lyase